MPQLLQKCQKNVDDNLSHFLNNNFGCHVLKIQYRCDINKNVIIFE
jgi:hypothetical protein